MTRRQSWLLVLGLANLAASTAIGVEVSGKGPSLSSTPLLFSRGRSERHRADAEEGSFMSLVSSIGRAVARLQSEDKLAAYESTGVWVRGSPKQEAKFQEEAAASDSSRHTYGFYLHTYSQPAANIHLLETLRKTYPDEPVYIMSDGGLGFEGICKQIGNCNFQWRPPANDRWNPKPFFDRMKEAARWLGTKYVIMLEPDNEIHGKIAFGPTYDAGGLKDSNPGFEPPLMSYLEKQGQLASGNSSFRMKWGRFGLAGGSYFRTAAILHALDTEKIDWHALRKLDGKRIWSSDVAMPLALAVHGYTFYPWEDLTQTRFENYWGKPTWQPAFQHHGREESNKPFYNMKNVTVESLVGQVEPRRQGLGKVICQGCVWASDAECWKQKPLACPITGHDMGPGLGPTRDLSSSRSLAAK